MSVRERLGIELGYQDEHAQSFGGSHPAVAKVGRRPIEAMHGNHQLPEHRTEARAGVPFDDDFPLRDRQPAAAPAALSQDSFFVM
jgi:hypothetical protein